MASWFAFLVGGFFDNMTKATSFADEAITYIDGALVGSSTVVNAVASLQTSKVGTSGDYTLSGATTFNARAIFKSDIIVGDGLTTGNSVIYFRNTSGTGHKSLYYSPTHGQFLAQNSGSGGIVLTEDNFQTLFSTRVASPNGRLSAGMVRQSQQAWQARLTGEVMLNTHQNAGAVLYTEWGIPQIQRPDGVWVSFVG